MAGAKKPATPKVAATMQIVKHQDRTKPIDVHMSGTWTHVEVLSLERTMLKTLKQHLVAERKRNQESKGQANG